MCDVCGCGDPQVVSLPVHERILSANEHQALHNREHYREHTSQIHGGNDEPFQHQTQEPECVAAQCGKRFPVELSNRARRSTEKVSNKSNGHHGVLTSVVSRATFTKSGRSDSIHPR